MASDDLVLGLDRPIHETTIAPSILGKSPKTTIQSECSSNSVLSQTPCLASGFKTKLSQEFSKSVANRIKAPQRLSSKRV